MTLEEEIEIRTEGEVFIEEHGDRIAKYIMRKGGKILLFYGSKEEYYRIKYRKRK